MNWDDLHGILVEQSLQEEERHAAVRFWQRSDDIERVTRECSVGVPSEESVGTPWIDTMASGTGGLFVGLPFIGIAGVVSYLLLN